ncbi:spermatogenesis- and oogenesis-specific basic helix-loop-helix-containing protein 2 [Tachyglossus aculeatus]|uniref:spermatogenesis- and oogenesis-specific basic helix-loop-helix-containing protein 2 n=1 Tax=Tachyglossus aculeatus TaxID=9261 RepID=UPI0018F4495D|nr:spermatogenesis- and oogenesis-specific basic helix-loop-helix-containing protein 2 [Tachyglossus aculeatus]
MAPGASDALTSRARLAPRRSGRRRRGNATLLLATSAESQILSTRLIFLVSPEDKYGCDKEAKIALLLVGGDAAVGNTANTIQRLFSETASITITISDVKGAAVFLDDYKFNMVFLQMNSSPTVEELETVKLIRFRKKKNIHLLFVIIIPVNFEDCISGHGADIILTEPLTLEKLDVVVKYWRSPLSNTDEDGSKSPGGNLELSRQMSCDSSLTHCITDLVTCGSKLISNSAGNGSVPNSKKSKRISLLHSGKEKLRRERIKDCCKQLRALLPCIEGRKNDAASVLEATADYMKCIQEKIPPVIMAQIVMVLQSNKRFCKKRQVFNPPDPPTAMPTSRDSNESTNITSSRRETGLWANKHLDRDNVPPFGGPLDEVLKGNSSSASEIADGEVCKNIIPPAVLSLNSFHTSPTVNSHSQIASCCDVAAKTNQNSSIGFPSVMTTVSEFPSNSNNSRLTQASPAPHSYSGLFQPY